MKKACRHPLHQYIILYIFFFHFINICRLKSTLLLFRMKSTVVNIIHKVFPHFFYPRISPLLFSVLATSLSRLFHSVQPSLARPASISFVFHIKLAHFLRGPFAQKMTKLKQNFLLLTKYEHVADIVVKFYSCATYVKGV